jgi:hypothetical protein
VQAEEKRLAIMELLSVTLGMAAFTQAAQDEVLVFLQMCVEMMIVTNATMTTMVMMVMRVTCCGVSVLHIFIIRNSSPPPAMPTLEFLKTLTCGPSPCDADAGAHAHALCMACGLRL